MVVVEVVLQSRLVGLTRLLVLEQHLLNADLLQNSRKLVVVEEVDHGVLDEEPGGDQGQAAVLTVEAVVISVEGEVVKIEEPQPVTFAGVGVAADGIILIGQPDDEDDVEGCRRVVEEL